MLNSNCGNLHISMAIITILNRKKFSFRDVI